MSYKLIATDMDGTLLNSKNEISPENLKIIETLRENGIIFSVATGRLDTMVKAYLRQMHSDSPVISCNGALVRNLASGQTYCESTIDTPDYTKVFNICYKYKLPFNVYGSYAMFSETENERIKLWREYNKTFCEEDRLEMHIVKNIYDEFNSKDKVFKVLIEHQDLDFLRKIEEEINEIPGITAYKSSTHLLDVMKKDVSKGNALKKLAEILGIKREEVIALGDNVNDLSMLSYAGVGIAMGNAEDCVKEVADFVTDSNDNDGVAKALKKILNIK